MANRIVINITLQRDEIVHAIRLPTKKSPLTIWHSGLFIYLTT
jgi:hypothetical protein